jgi:hypothetical protein
MDCGRYSTVIWYQTAEFPDFFHFLASAADCQLDKSLAIGKIHRSLTSVDVSVPLPREYSAGDLGEWEEFHPPQEQTLLCILPRFRSPADVADLAFKDFL